MTTRWPSDCKERAIAKPMPRFPPVTSAMEVESLMRENYPTVAPWLKKMTFSTSLVRLQVYLLISQLASVAISSP